MVPTTGLEPVRCYSLEPESSASANSATWATDYRRLARLRICFVQPIMSPSRIKAEKLSAKTSSPCRRSTTTGVSDLRVLESQNSQAQDVFNPSHSALAINIRRPFAQSTRSSVRVRRSRGHSSAFARHPLTLRVMATKRRQLQLIIRTRSKN